MSTRGIVIKIDNRETDLIPLIERRIEAHLSDSGLSASSQEKSKKHNNGCLVPLHMFDNVEVSNNILHGEVTDARENAKLHKMKIEQLHIGDVVFEDDSGKPILIFERKTLNDLAASIKDGRYNEQSFRLDKEPIHNHNIIYIIEGDIERYNEKRTHISKKTLMSTMFSLLYYKGFSVLRTNMICETADTIVFFADKYDKTSINEKTRKPYYELSTLGVGGNGGCSGATNAVIQEVKEVKEVKELTETEESEKYCGVVKGHKEKNEYITPENINIIMLSCIPGINSKTATQIMSEYKTVQNLLYQLEKDPACLNTFMIKTELGNMRKINKNCVDNIKKFLC
jgi:ERCC4-type nuclease